MKTKLCFIIAIFFSIATNSQTPIPAGPISGTWTLDGSPYRIYGETTIPNDSTLSIEPGIEVIWQGSYSMWVEGQILAQGTVTDTIVFTAADTADGFRSIRFIDTPTSNDTSRFEYCAFKYGRVHGLDPDNHGGAIGVINYNKLVFKHCYFYRNRAIDISDITPTGGAIALGSSSPVIENCSFYKNESRAGGAIMCADSSNAKITNNFFNSNKAISEGESGGHGGAIVCWIDSKPVITRNTFTNNWASIGGGAVMCGDTSNSLIDHNLFYNNWADWRGGAINIQSSFPTILNNTIVNNGAGNYGGGIDISYGGSGEIINTILWGNEASVGNQVNIAGNAGNPNFRYCDIEGGEGGIGGHPEYAVFTDCFDHDPVFENEDGNDYHILPNSPCCDKGHPVMFDPDETRCDVGLYYCDQRPVNALNPTGHTQTSFVANWEEAETAIGYLLDVSTDPEFETFLEGYHNLDVGNVLSYLVEGLEPGTPCYYRVRANYYFGRSDYSNLVGLTVTTPEFVQIPVSLKVIPNPISNSTVVEFALPDRVPVQIALYNLSGRKVQTLVGAQQTEGVHQYQWDASTLPNGIYLIRLTAGQWNITRKIIKQ